MQQGPLHNLLWMSFRSSREHSLNSDKQTWGCEISYKTILAAVFPSMSWPGNCHWVVVPVQSEAYEWQKPVQLLSWALKVVQRRWDQLPWNENGKQGLKHLHHWGFQRLVQASSKCGVSPGLQECTIWGQLWVDVQDSSTADAIVLSNEHHILCILSCSVKVAASLHCSTYWQVLLLSCGVQLQKIARLVVTVACATYPVASNASKVSYPILDISGLLQPPLLQLLLSPIFSFISLVSDLLLHIGPPTHRLPLPLYVQTSL